VSNSNSRHGWLISYVIFSCFDLKNVQKHWLLKHLRTFICYILGISETLFGKILHIWPNIWTYILFRAHWSVTHLLTWLYQPVSTLGVDRIGTTYTHNTPRVTYMKCIAKNVKKGYLHFNFDCTMSGPILPIYTDLYRGCICYQHMCKSSTIVT